MKSFNEILKESKSITIKNGALKLGGGAFAYCRVSDSDSRDWNSNSKYFDLIFEGPGGKRVVEKEWATYSTGFDQSNMIFGQKCEGEKFYLRSKNGEISGGNGQGYKKKETPQLYLYDSRGRLAKELKSNYYNQFLDVYNSDYDNDGLYIKDKNYEKKRADMDRKLNPWKY